MSSAKRTERRDNLVTAEARARRRELEGLLEQTALAPGGLDQIWNSLGDADPRIRYAARIALERQPVELWEQRALREQDRLSALTAMSAIGASGECGDSCRHPETIERDRSDRRDSHRATSVGVDLSPMCRYRCCT